MSIKSLLTAGAFMLIASPALAQQGQMPARDQGERRGPFERADGNGDGVLTRDEVRIARTAAFTRLDVNRDGFLVREEMPQPPMGHHGGRIDGQRGDIGPDGPPPPVGNQGERSARGSELLRRADVNGDGNVTRTEFDAAIVGAQAVRAKNVDARNSRTFTLIDANSDGTISRAEADAARTAMHGRHGGENQRPDMPNPDTNNDQKVSLAEWLARPDPLFERGDTNNDGRVTREEAAAFMRQGRGAHGGRPRPW